MFAALANLLLSMPAPSAGDRSFCTAVANRTYNPNNTYSSHLRSLGHWHEGLGPTQYERSTWTWLCSEQYQVQFSDLNFLSSFSNAPEWVDATNLNSCSTR
jgi:hypothetical protein